MNRKSAKMLYAIAYGLLCLIFWVTFLSAMNSIEGQSGADYLSYYLAMGSIPFLLITQMAFGFSTSYLVFETQKTGPKTVLNVILLIVSTAFAMNFL